MNIDRISSGMNELKTNIADKLSSFNPDARIVPRTEKVSDEAETKLSDLDLSLKDKLKSSGMSECNLEKCKIDGNGVVHLKTDNEYLAGRKHPETKVPFEKKTINLDGIKIEGVFPQFKSVFECELPKDKVMAADGVQFRDCRKQLAESIYTNPQLARQFSAEDKQRILDGHNPRGYVWHHSENVGVMQLVKFEDHAKTSHTGGNSIWGGGNTGV